MGGDEHDSGTVGEPGDCFSQGLEDQAGAHVIDVRVTEVFVSDRTYGRRLVAGFRVRDVHTPDPIKAALIEASTHQVGRDPSLGVCERCDHFECAVADPGLTDFSGHPQVPLDSLWAVNTISSRSAWR